MRSPARLATDSFDVLVVGAGIHGATAAAAAARAGLRVALIDRRDFGAASSANSLKVIHGGLRYLQHLDFKRMRESIYARSLLLRLAPHLVRPRSFLMPTAGLGLRSLPVMSLALLGNELVSIDRNRRLARERYLPMANIHFSDAASRLIPSEVEGLTGAAVWHDAVAEDTERVTLAFVRDAAARGAVVANYVGALRFLRDGSRIAGVEARDEETRSAFPIRARTVIWAGGPWLDAVDPTLAGSGPASRAWVRAINLVIDKPWPLPHGVAVESRASHHDPDAVMQRGKRNLFFVPWRNGVMVGTWYDAYQGDPGALRVLPEEIDGFVAELQAACPALRIERDHVSMVHAGILPAHPVQATDPAKMPILRKGPRDGLPEGLVYLQGVKYTTGPKLGAAAADLAARDIGSVIPPTVWDDPLPGGNRLVDEVDVTQWCASCGFAMPESAARHLAMSYGSEFPSVLELTRAAVRLRSVLPGQSSVIAAAVVHAVREESAVRLVDVVLRRTGLGTFARPADEALVVAARLMAEELGWSPDRVQSELAAVGDHYDSLGIVAGTPSPS